MLPFIDEYGLVVLYVLTGDPAHYGHLDVIRRGFKLRPKKLIVALYQNVEKNPWLTLEQRIHALELMLQELEPGQRELVEIMTFPENEKATELAARVGTPVILRGFRGHIDYDQEENLALLYRLFDENVEVFWVQGDPNLKPLSSTAIRWVLKNKTGKKDLLKFVNEATADYLLTLFPAA